MTGRRVAVIEDDPAYRALIAQALEAAGHRVACEDEGPEAVAKIALCRPDAVILDMGLRGTSGGAVYAALRADPATRDTPVVICTVHRANTIRRQLKGPRPLEDPRLFQVYKPFQVRALLGVLSQAFGGDPREA